MSTVVLRCPTCGTTQTHTGQCDACAEGDVRYFCTNHTPGLWLDEARCGACGAKFGDAPAPKSTPRAAATRSGIPPRRERRTPARDAVPADPIPRRPRPTVIDADDPDAPPSLADVLVDMLEEGKRTRGTVEDPPWREPVEPIGAAPRAPFIAGCLGRLMLLVLLLIVLALAGLSTLFGASLY